MRIIFTRHGESYANTQNIISNRGLIHGLTPKGRVQAASLARKLQDYPISRIYTSPLLRAIETSVIFAYSLEVDYEVNDALREFDTGSLEGRNDEDAWETMKRTFEGWMKGERREVPLCGGESFQDVQNRFVPFIDHLIQQHRASEANLVCVAHGGIYWMMLPLVLENVDIQYISNHNGFDHTTIVVSEQKAGVLTCSDWILVEN